MSTEKTEKLALHRWVAEDPFLRAEFNDNFTAIDRQFAAVDDRLTTHTGQHAADGTDPITPDMIGAAGGSNLLDNWYFAEPINQRGKPEYSEKGYTIDRWHFNTAGSDLLSLQSGGVKVSSGSAASAPSIDQFLEIPSSIAGKTVTFSVKVREVGGTGGTNRGYIVFVIDGAEALGAGAIFQDSGVFSVTTTIPSGATSVEVRCAAYWNNYAVYEAAKLELGSTQTLAHQDEDGSWVLNDPPPNRAAELAKCQRYYYSTLAEGGFKNCVAFTNTEAASHPVVNVRFPVEMRATPAVTIVSVDGSTQDAISYMISTATVQNLTVTALESVTGRQGFAALSGSKAINAQQYAFHYIADADL